MTDWQPIETVPLRIPVLIWDGEIMCVAEGLGGPRASIYWCCIGADGYECKNTFNSPTHWMPLPEPPA